MVGEGVGLVDIRGMHAREGPEVENGAESEDDTKHASVTCRVSFTLHADVYVYKITHCCLHTHSRYNPFELIMHSRYTFDLHMAPSIHAPYTCIKMDRYVDIIASDSSRAS